MDLIEIRQLHEQLRKTAIANDVKSAAPVQSIAGNGSHYMGSVDGPAIIDYISLLVQEVRHA